MLSVEWRVSSISSLNSPLMTLLRKTKVDVIIANFESLMVIILILYSSMINALQLVFTMSINRYLALINHLQISQKRERFSIIEDSFHGIFRLHIDDVFVIGMLFMI